MNNINEFFELSPTGLENWGTVAGYNIKSNQTIVDTIKELSIKDKSTKNISDIISKGLDNRIIIVGFLDKTFNLSTMFKDIKKWISHIDIFGLLGNDESNKILGVFSVDDNKVAVILDDSVDFLGNRTRDILPTLTHELIHFCAAYNANKFLNTTMYSFLLPYYKDLFSRFSVKSVEIDDEKLKRAIIKVCKLDTKRLSSNRHLLEAFVIWAKYLEEEYEKKEAFNILKYMVLPYLMFIEKTGKGVYHQRALASVKKYYAAYESIFDMSFNQISEITLPGQEICSVSEVASITNQNNPDPRLVSMIKQLPMESR